MLKVGLSQYGLKQVDAAERTLAEVVAAAIPAPTPRAPPSDRLRAIQLGRAPLSPDLPARHAARPAAARDL